MNLLQCNTLIPPALCLLSLSRLILHLPESRTNKSYLGPKLGLFCKPRGPLFMNLLNHTCKKTGSREYTCDGWQISGSEEVACLLKVEGRGAEPSVYSLLILMPLWLQISAARVRLLALRSKTDCR